MRSQQQPYKLPPSPRCSSVSSARRSSRLLNPYSISHCARRQRCNCPCCCLRALFHFIVHAQSPNRKCRKCAHIKLQNATTANAAKRSLVLLRGLASVAATLQWGLQKLPGNCALDLVATVGDSRLEEEKRRYLDVTDSGGAQGGTRIDNKEEKVGGSKIFFIEYNNRQLRSQCSEQAPSTAELSEMIASQPHPAVVAPSSFKCEHWRM